MTPLVRADGLRNHALRLRRFLTIEHYRNSAHDFVNPWPRDCPYCALIHTPIPGEGRFLRDRERDREEARRKENGL